MQQNIEIMAPVGSWESLQAAIQGGANAVYFGVGKLNMRSRSAANFTVDDLPRIVSICKAAPSLYVFEDLLLNNTSTHSTFWCEKFKQFRSVQSKT